MKQKFEKVFNLALIDKLLRKKSYLHDIRLKKMVNHVRRVIKTIFRFNSNQFYVLFHCLKYRYIRYCEKHQSLGHNFPTTFVLY